MKEHLNIAYLATLRLPTERAYGVNVAKTCEALAAQGVALILHAPLFDRARGVDFFSYYGIKNNFKIDLASLPGFLETPSRIHFWLLQLFFAFKLVFGGRLGKKNETVVLTRDEPLAGFIAALSGYKVYYDMHGFPMRRVWFWRIALRRMRGVAVTNRWKALQCERVLGIPHENIVIAPNGFDAVLFEKGVGEERRTLRDRLGLPHKPKIVMYTGHFYDWKGAHVLLNAARLSNEQKGKDTLFVFVGGTEQDSEGFVMQIRGLGNVLHVGHRPHHDIPLYVRAADVLVLPNSARSSSPRLAEFSKHDTSPIKLFEYMASGTPIVASDLPSVTEIVDKGSAVLVPPDDPEALRKGIESLLQDKQYADKIAEQALALSKNYTWEKRAERILMLIEKTQ